MRNIINNTRINAVCGRLSKLKKGPIIVNSNPNVEETKNVGNRSRFSQKSTIVLSGFVFTFYRIVEKLAFVLSFLYINFG
jgi:hypothetical protein